MGDRNDCGKQIGKVPRQPSPESRMKIELIENECFAHTKLIYYYC